MSVFVDMFDILQCPIAKADDRMWSDSELVLLEIGALFYRLPDGRFSGIDQDI